MIFITLQKYQITLSKNRLLNSVCTILIIYLLIFLQNSGFFLYTERLSLQPAGNRKRMKVFFQSI